jgi:hypothetical protein
VVEAMELELTNLLIAREILSVQRVHNRSPYAFYQGFQFRIIQGLS